MQDEITAMRRRIEEMEKESLQQRQIIAKLEAENVQLHYRIAHSQYSEKDWEDFDPGEYTVSAEELLANARKRLQQAP